MQIKISKNLEELAKLFPELYIVGGYIRNQIMGIKNDDVDIVSPLTLDEVEKLLKDSDYSIKIKSKVLGSALICCGEEKYEYTTFRKDYYPQGGAHLPKGWNL